MDLSESPTDDRQWQQWIPTEYTVPGDVVAVVTFVLCTNVVLYSPLSQIPVVRGFVGLPLLFFVPGYALISCLFPGHSSVELSQLNRWDASDGSGARKVRTRGFDGRERAALSFGMSVALLPLVAVSLSLLGLSYSLGVISASVTVVTVVLLGGAIVRRNRLPAQQRFRVPYRRWFDRIDRGLGEHQPPIDMALNVGLAVVVLASVATVGFAMVAPNHAESFTSVTVLTTDEGGDLSAAGYPDTIDATGEELVFKVENNEGKSVTYTVVGELQHVRQTGQSVTVFRSREFVRTSSTVEDGGAWTEQHTVQPTLKGEDLRLIYYVYRGEAPADPSTATAYRHVNVWVDVPIESGS